MILRNSGWAFRVFRQQFIHWLSNAVIPLEFMLNLASTHNALEYVIPRPWEWYRHMVWLNPQRLMDKPITLPCHIVTQEKQILLSFYGVTCEDRRRDGGAFLCLKDCPRANVKDCGGITWRYWLLPVIATVMIFAFNRWETLSVYCILSIAGSTEPQGMTASIPLPPICWLSIVYLITSCRI